MEKIISRWLCLLALIAGCAPADPPVPIETCGPAEETPAKNGPATPLANPTLKDYLIILGAGSPVPDPETSGSAIAIVVNDTTYLVDLGVGVVRRMQEAADRGHTALDPKRVGRAFITHLHSDHTLGLPDYLFTPWIIGRPSGTEIFGPYGLSRMTDNILAAWGEDLEIRHHGKGADGFIEKNFTVHESGPGVLFQDQQVKVTAFPVSHGDWPLAFGYRFETARFSVVISGDTTPSESVINACAGCDILVHEVYSAAAVQQGPDDFTAYHRAYHTSTIEVADVARQATPKLLVLYHRLEFGVSDEALLQEVRQNYSGPVALAADLDVFTLKND